MEPGRAQVLVAVKALPAAKSRLAPPLTGSQRSALVLAMLADTVAAALRCAAVGAVHVVTRDAVVAERARAAGAAVLEDPTGTLDDALRHGAGLLDPAVAVLALPGDLPALRAAELDAAVAAAAGVRAAVADAQGSGTTLLLDPRADALDPRFGPGSAAAHAGSGAVLLPGRWPGLRRDVDTVADLGAALALGVGPATTALLDTTGAPATVARHDGGVVELRTDDGARVRAGDAAAARGGWRTLRAGQRVRVHTGTGGEVFLLTAATGLPG